MNADTRPYHHGDLAAALVDAAEEELTEKGIEGFSLRGVAKRAGVSHAAPAHHFVDVQGLLTAVATRGFERFVRRQADFRRRADPDARSQLVASGLGYVVFAMESPDLFRLMFGSSRTNFENADLAHAAGKAYDDLVHHVAMVRMNGHSQQERHGSTLDVDLMRHVAAIWAVAHGLADLLVAERLDSIGTLPARLKREAITDVLRRVI
ncbi:MAG: TetR/AcrR family transcriptional regulator [Betaproteobacteria bacterium]